MAKRLSEKEKVLLVKYFTEGKTIDYLSDKFDCSKLTISRNLKKNLGEKEYKKVLIKNKIQKVNNSDEDLFSKNDDRKYSKKQIIKQSFTDQQVVEKNFRDQTFSVTPYIEVTPLNYDFENETQKDLSSIPIEDMNFPKIVFMIVDRNIELEIKYLKDFPEWQFLSQDELTRKTIQVYTDMKLAKRFCNKEQKVIKVPNPNVFKIVAPLLVSRGITRIVNEENLIAL